ncbi:glucose-6-phosphate dehydrogenase assembly protein OpcA [Kytococcus aerolatus]|uniref:Glucose-6-phosphate dehydrogenase assembly protein OpcA n=1 Tax=Kytococcus aerolatus TaxID=592308 RepID=A0A212T0G5_9MICO|nr:glucose-6-phosphate dehydrogenase assembly protein OpcA [Kytococcus aerolatus]SNC59509.1 glucose-6-phosphate dehydrogenase assembly protein OpcA [Kytococcus aerolatus]
MILDYPDVSARHLSRELVRLRADQGAMALGRVLSLAVVTDLGSLPGVLETATAATRQHPSRIIVLVRDNALDEPRLDAQIRLGGDAGASEIVVLYLHGALVEHEHAVLLPLLLPDSPIVAWWPGRPPEELHSSPLAQVASRRITTVAQAEDPAQELRRLASDYEAGDTDIAWTRLTRWRALLAAVLDEPPFEEVQSATVSGGSDSPRVDLLAFWLGRFLECPVVRARSAPGQGVESVRLQRASGPVDLVRIDGENALLLAPGRRARRVTLPHTTLAQSLSAELHRLDVDDVYEAVLESIDTVDLTVMSTADALAAGILRDRDSALDAESQEIEENA